MSRVQVEPSRVSIDPARVRGRVNVEGPGRATRGDPVAAVMGDRDDRLAAG